LPVKLTPNEIASLRSLTDADLALVMEEFGPTTQEAILKHLAVAGPKDERTSAADRMARKRAAIRDLHIPEVEDVARRQEREADDTTWLRACFPHIFYNPFSPDHLKLIEDCGRALEFGSKKCKGARFCSSNSERRKACCSTSWRIFSVRKAEIQPIPGWAFFPSRQPSRRKIAGRGFLRFQ